MAWRHRHSRAPRHHPRPIRRRWHICHVHKLDIEDEVRFGWNSRMRRIGSWTSTGTVCQLPRDEQATFPDDFHACKALIKSWNQTPKALWKSHWQRVSEFRLAVRSHDRLAVLVEDWLAMILRRIEFVPVCRKPPGVQNLVDLVRLSLGASADLDVLIAQREGSLNQPACWRDSRRQFHSSRGSRGSLWRWR